MPDYIEFNHISKIYQSGETIIKALDEAKFTVKKGELAIILGASGAGKTTALNILGGMDIATSGQLFVDGNEISKYTKKQLVEYRRFDIGFVFQFYNLIPNLTALENVELAKQTNKKDNGLASASDILEQVGLKERKHNFPGQLSGGEQQRVSIARAIAKNPKLLLCDEPTGALDYTTGKQILALLQLLCHDEKMTILIITHNSAIAPMADRIISFKNGKVVSITYNTPVPVSKIEW